MTDSQADMDVINAFMREAATQAVADMIREHGGGQLSLAQGMPPAVPAECDPSVYPADNIGRPPRTVTVVPVEDVGYSRPDGRTGRSPLWWAVCGVCLAAAGLLVWGVISLVMSIGDAVATGHNALPTVITLAVLTYLTMLCWKSRRRNGTSFSGTFSGRMHE